MKYLPLLLLLTGCAATDMTNTYNIKAYDESYIKFSNDFDIIEDIRVSRKQKQLDIHRAFYKLEPFKYANSDYEIYLRNTYLPITIDHINMKNKRGGYIIGRKLRLTLTDHVE